MVQGPPSPQKNDISARRLDEDVKAAFPVPVLRRLLSMAYNGDVNRSHRQNDSSSFHGR